MRPSRTRQRPDALPSVVEVAVLDPRRSAPGRRRGLLRRRRFGPWRELV